MKLNPIGPNQNELHTKKGTIFFSYKTPVAACVDGKFYRTSFNWSRTTTRHINKWLGNVIADEKEQSFFDKLVK